MTAAEPEYRQCPLTHRWVIFAPERALRPIELPHSEPVKRTEPGDHRDCPFCPGNEANTPQPLYVVPDPTAEYPWLLRVVPNRYPAVREHLLEAPATHGDAWSRHPGFGFHEVIIQCPQHHSDPTQLPAEQYERLLQVYQQRLLHFSTQPGLAYAMIFNNVGAEAGASLAHLHSQLLAMPMVPNVLQTEHTVAMRYWAKTKQCLYCDVLRRERELGSRIILETEQFVVVCPYAPRFAYEVWVLPTRHECHFLQATETELRELATILRRLFVALEQLLDHPAYNWYLHEAALHTHGAADYHWHIEIAPRTARPAGFEWGSGCFINAVPPETATEHYRAVL